MNFKKSLKDSLLSNNPVLGQLLGLCSTMAITTTLFNGIGILYLSGSNILFPSVIDEDNLLNAILSFSRPCDIHCDVTCTNNCNRLTKIVCFGSLKKINCKVNMAKSFAEKSESVRLGSSNRKEDSVISVQEHILNQKI